MEAKSNCYRRDSICLGKTQVPSPLLAWPR